MKHYLSWDEALSQWWRRTLCAILGHAKLEQRMWCRTCSQCHHVLPGRLNHVHP